MRFERLLQTAAVPGQTVVGYRNGVKYRLRYTMERRWIMWLLTAEFDDYKLGDFATAEAAFAELAAEAKRRTGNEQ